MGELALHNKKINLFLEILQIRFKLTLIETNLRIKIFKLKEIGQIKVII